MTASYFENMPLLMPGSTTLANGVSTIHVVPFVLPGSIVAAVIRVPVSLSLVSTNVAGTSAGTTFSFARYHSQAAVLYSQGTGANSLSLQSIASGNGAWTVEHHYGTIETNGSYTVSHYLTFPNANFSLSTISTFVNNNVASYRLATAIGLSTVMNGMRFIDISFSTNMSAGNYWLGFGVSTSSVSNAGPNGLQGASYGMSTVGVSQSDLSWGHLAGATNNSIQIQPGQGIWTTNSAVMSTASMALANISAVVSNPKMYFQLINRA